MRLLLAAVLLATLAGCAHPVYLCQGVGPGLIACVDSRDVEQAIKSSEPAPAPAPRPGA